MLGIDDMIYIGDLLDRPALLAALWTAAKIHDPFRPGAAGPVSWEEAFWLLAMNSSGYVGYHRGRALKVCLAGEYLDAGLYDRDNGEGKAGRVVADVRSHRTPVGGS